jgi:hypothetical protein
MTLNLVGVPDKLPGELTIDYPPDILDILMQLELVSYDCDKHSGMHKTCFNFLLIFDVF